MRCIDHPGDLVVRIDRFELSDSVAIKRLATAHGLPYLKRFLKHIEHRQAQADERFGRRYQRSILRRGGLRLFSPKTGAPILAAESIAMNGKTFYRFMEADRTGAANEYFVIASRIRFGFPLVGLFVPQKNVLLSWESGGKHAVRNLHLSALAETRNTRDSSTRISETPVILMGHTSFAHHLWNELSALETIIHSGSLPPTSPILVAREPLGDIEEIFPELLGHAIFRVDPGPPLCGIRTGSLFVNLGALCIPERLRRRMVAFAQSRASAAARAIIADIERMGGPVFWISVRTQNPTLTNQHDVLARVTCLLLHAYRHCTVVFDGFSLPEDTTRMTADMQTAYARYAAETRKASEDIIASVHAMSPPGPRQWVTSIAGMSLLDCFAIAQCATVYLCHAGSVQHKIGWTANVPGIIHGNRRVSTEGLLARHSARLENGVAPMVAPKEMLDEVVSGENERNYVCVDPAEFSRFVLGYFRQCLSLVPGVPAG